MTTRSSPPSKIDDAAHATFDVRTFRRAAPSEGVIFFCVEDAPRSACSTHPGADGTLTFETSLNGRVMAVEPDALVLQIGGGITRVLHHLPSGITLDPLVGQVIGFELRQIYRGPGRATIDAELTDDAGQMILWVRDGRFPSDADAHGLSLRLSVDPLETRLALRTDHGITSLQCPGARQLVVGGSELTLALVRLGADDVSFVLMRG